MTLQFDPSIYERINERKQNQDSQNRQSVADSISSIPQSLMAYVQQQKQDQEQQRQNRMSDIQTANSVIPNGGDPNAAMAYMQGTSIPQVQQNSGSTDKGPMDQGAPSPNPLSLPSMTPQAPQPSMFSGNAPQTPPQAQGRGVLDHWDQTAPAHLQSKATLADVFPKQNNYNTVLTQMQNGDMSGISSLSKQDQARMKEDPRYQKIVKPAKPEDNLNYAQAKLIIPTLNEKDWLAAYPSGSAPKEHIAMMSKPSQLSTMNTSTYDTAPADDQRLARSLASGNIRPSDIGYRDRGRIVSLANEYADSQGQSFQSYGGDVKAGMAKGLAYGKMGQNVVSFNTALGHIGDAEKAYQSVGNTDQRWLNTPLNVLKRQSNDPNIIALGLNLNAVAGELATAFKGSGGTDQEISHFANLLTDDLTPAQAHAALQKAGELLNSRINAVQNQQSSVMHGTGGERQLISPHGSDVMNQLHSSQNQSALMWQGRPLKDTPANRAWLAQQGGQQ